MGLISENLNNQLDELIGKCFAINRMLDRGMSLLAVRFKLIKSAEILHPNVAHAYLGDKFADGLAGYQALRDNETIYPVTPIGNREYATVLDFFKDYHKENLELEDMLISCIDIAVFEKDYTTKKFLDGILENLSKFTGLSQTLIDLSTQYGNESFNLQVMDSVLKKYIDV